MSYANNDRIAALNGSAILHVIYDVKKKLIGIQLSCILSDALS